MSALLPDRDDLAWTMEHLPQLHIIRVVTRGRITLPRLLDLGRELLALAQQVGTTRALVDHRLASPEIGTLDIYEMPESISRIGGSRVHRIAVVFDMNSTRSADITFYENRMANSGFSHRVFADPEKALAWLAEAAPKSSASAHSATPPSPIPPDSNA